MYGCLLKLVSITFSRYGPEILTCHLDDQRVPEFVSIGESSCQHADNLLHIKKPAQKTSHTFTVCTAPLIHNYDDEYQFVEFIESNRAFGAEYFVLYDYECSSLLYPYLKAYLQEGIIKIIQWPGMPFLNTTNNTQFSPTIHNFGQVVALADCVYRHMFDSQYIAYIDLDEMIVPRDGNSWRSLIERANQPNAFLDRMRIYLPFLPTIHNGAFSFRNKFFLSERDASNEKLSGAAEQNHLNLSSAMLSLIREYHIRCLSLTRVSSTFYPHGVRSKYIMHPPDVLLPGIHLVFRFYSFNTRMYKFDAETAMLHHYRGVVHEHGTDRDFIVLTYINALLPQIVSRHTSVREQSQIMH